MNLEKFVENIIREAQERGDFENLKNAGKPIDLNAYFETPEDTRIAASVLQNANIISLKNLQENLSLYKKNIFEIPLIMQYNKRDLTKTEIPVLDVDILENDLNSELKVPAFEASAVEGDNVILTLKKIISATMASLEKELK